MGKKLRHLIENIDKNLGYYFSEFFLERFWIDIRIYIEEHLFPMPPNEEREATRKYIARLSPDQAVRYSRNLVEIWRWNAKLVYGADYGHEPARVRRKKVKRRLDILEGARIAEKIYAEALERKRLEDSS